LARELFTARLARKECISEPAQCFHFDFVIDELESFPYLSGQFISAVATDENGKQQTRAYSMASAASGNRFELCINRVEAGFFSNRLADLPDDPDELLPVGGKIHFHGPHGLFTLREPMNDAILVATGTGVAPMRSFLQWLYPENGPDRSNGRQVWLVYGTRHESELYYRREFEDLALRKAKFHYLPTLSRAEETWTGLRGYVQDHVVRIIEERAHRLGQPVGGPAPDAATPAAEFEIYAYICGLNEMVAGVRERLSGLGWNRKQVIYERYD
jgi:ferredoxin-NADP reductase